MAVSIRGSASRLRLFRASLLSPPPLSALNWRAAQPAACRNALKVKSDGGKGDRVGVCCTVTFGAVWYVSVCLPTININTSYFVLHTKYLVNINNDVKNYIKAI